MQLCNLLINNFYVESQLLQILYTVVGIYIKLLNNKDTHKYGNKEKM